MRSRPRWIATLPVSLALHVGLVVAALPVLRLEWAPTPLILDLEAISAGPAEGPGAGSPSPAGGAASASRAAPRVTARVATRSLVPSPPATTPPRSEAPERAVDAREAASAPPSPVASPPAPAPTPAQNLRASGSGDEPSVTRATSQDSDTGAPMSGRGGGAGSGASVGEHSPGRAGGEVVAALPPGTGSGMGGAGLGTEYGPYLAGIRQWIQAALRYPPAARRRGVAGTVQLEIAIAADGAVSTVSVITSSSHEILDRAAVDAARSLRRAPFPAGLRPGPITFRLPVVFDLQERP